jgi:predicted PurR-regulated permease PerM
MHTLLVFFAIIGGLKVFGILGIVYGPLIATAFLTLADIYRASYQKQVESDRNAI